MTPRARTSAKAGSAPAAPVTFTRIDYLNFKGLSEFSLSLGELSASITARERVGAADLADVERVAGPTLSALAAVIEHPSR
jgi:hypothetical protein